MERPSRPRGDILLPSGELIDIRRRLRPLAARHDVTSLVVAAFDPRTRMLPFIVADRRMAPAGPRAIGSTLLDAGFERTRVALQQMNPNIRPSLATLDGRPIDLLLVSSMQLHFERARELIRDAWSMGDRRPLIVSGGSKMFYEPWEAFSADPDNPAGADFAVTGEEYPLLAVLEIVLTERAEGEPLREAFTRVRDAGLLGDVPGLVYPVCGDRGQATALIDTGPQRMVGDLDEQAHPAPGLGIIEPPSRRRRTLASRPLPAGKVRWRFPLTPLVLTAGCKFGCPYCPIPAYNQRQYRTKSGRRIADEFVRLYTEYGLRFFFGSDDNFFNDRERTLDICETLARTEVDGVALRHIVRWGTEATVHDTLKMGDELRVARRAGMRAVWIGVEDMSGALVRKGQGEDRSVEAFRLLRRRGIIPMPMMMHHDAQPLLTRRDNTGLLNQVHLLHKAGAGSLQVLMITPSPGSKLYEKTYDDGMVYASVGGRPVEPHMHDGNYVIASRHPDPWKKQLNLMAAYAMYYNPLRLLQELARPFNRQLGADVVVQLVGMYGLAHTVRRTLGWAFRLMGGRIRRAPRAPSSPVPVLSPQKSPADETSPQPVR